MIIHPDDNVEVRDDGHKYALRAIAAHENVIKYGMPIGHATQAIVAGEHVHTHNLATNLSGLLEYAWEGGMAPQQTLCTETLQGFRRPDATLNFDQCFSCHFDI